MSPNDTHDSLSMALGLVAARVVIGTFIAAHGSQKLFGWFRGQGLIATGQLFESVGFHPGRTFAAAAGAAELLSGFLIILGILGPLGPALLMSVMIAAIITVHWGHGLLATSNGSELPALYIVAAIGLSLTGPGPYSLDAILGNTTLMSPIIVVGALAVGMIGGLASATLRSPRILGRV